MVAMNRADSLLPGVLCTSLAVVVAVEMTKQEKGEKEERRKRRRRR